MKPTSNTITDTYRSLDLVRLRFLSPERRSVPFTISHITIWLVRMYADTRTRARAIFSFILRDRNRDKYAQSFECTITVLLLTSVFPLFSIPVPVPRPSPRMPCPARIALRKFHAGDTVASFARDRDTHAIEKRSRSRKRTQIESLAFIGC